MSVSLNKVMLIGNLTRDPETRTTPSGQTVSSFGLATNRTWKDQNGVKQEKAEFHQIVAWGKLAELCGQYLSKGRRAWIEGRLQTRDWTGEDGIKRYRTEIIADSVIFLDRAGALATPEAALLHPASQQAPVAENVIAMDATASPPLPPQEDIQVENIPF